MSDVHPRASVLGSVTGSVIKMQCVRKGRGWVGGWSEHPSRDS